MPRVIVQADVPQGPVLMNELVNPEHLHTDHDSEQLIERLAWSIDDAARVEAAQRDSVPS